MPSPQARLASAFIRTIVRRRKWGDERAVVRRARWLMGSPKIYQWWRTRGVRIKKVADGGVRGEWVEVEHPAPGVILYIHGGGYVACSPATHRPITAALARLSRRRVFSLDYRLATEHRFPSAIDDAVAAYRWLLAQGLAAKRIAIAGDSAGGGLTLALLLRARDAGLPLPASAVCFSAWTDLAGTGASVRENEGRCAMFRPENINEFASVYLRDASALNIYASPLYADMRALPKVLLQVGSTELLLDDSRAVHHKIQEAGGASVLEIYDDVPHCWQMFDGLVPEARVALRSATGFINARFNNASTDVVNETRA